MNAVRTFAAAVIGAGLALAGAGGAVLDGAPAAAGRLTIDALLDIRHPSDAAWSPDGRHVAFLWERAGVQDVWVVDVDGERAAPPRQLTHHEQGLVQALFWGRDSDTLYFARQGDLRTTSVSGGAARAVWTTPEAEAGITLAPAGDRVAFSRRGDIWVRTLAEGAETRLTSTPAAESAPVWSPDGARIAFGIATSTPKSQAFDYHGPKILFTWSERVGLPDVGIVAATGGPTTLAASTPGAESAPRWLDAERLVLQRIDGTQKIREVVIVDAATGAGHTVFKDVEDKWFNLTYNGAAPLPSPDGRFVAVISDRDGWDQIYAIQTTDGRTTQLTRGAADSGRLAWSRDSRRLVFDRDDDGSPGRRHLSIVEADAGQPLAPRVLTSGRGTNTGAIWSPSDDRLLYQHTDPRSSADLFVVPVAGSSAPRPTRLTDSLPASIDRRALVEPQAVWYRAPDGQQAPAKLFVPPGLDRSRKHPALVWIHPDGVNQNYDGWHIERNQSIYYSFHQYLVQRGYIILTPDFRTSIGYGKAWRLGAYHDMGGKDYDDVAAGVGYLKTLGFVDMDRIGVFGLSGGGFLTLQALTRTPTLFRCGIDIAGVTDFGDYQRDPGPAVLVARMGTREENPAVYEQAAPIRRVDRIVRPLLVLAATADTNVPYEQSVRLVDALLKAGRDFDYMMYPGEGHYYRREHIVRDAWTRIERFFDRHLRGAKEATRP